MTRLVAGIESLDDEHAAAAARARVFEQGRIGLGGDAQIYFASACQLQF
jgi:hypothetical protein